MAGLWLDQTDLVNVLSTATFAAIFNDPVTGILNLDIVASVIDRAEQEVLSWLVDEYGPDVRDAKGLGGDRFLKGAAIEFAIVYAFDRYPEYVKANGKEREDRYKLAQELMQRVLSSIQRPTSMPLKPANVGGVSVDGGPRIVADDANGNRNSGDY